jgi:hypothetical protein
METANMRCQAENLRTQKHFKVGFGLRREIWTEMEKRRSSRRLARVEVRTFDFSTGIWKPKKEISFAFDESMRDGVSLAILRTASGNALAVSPESWSSSVFRLFDGKTHEQIVERPVFAVASRNGTVIAAFDFDGDGFDEIAAAQNGGTNAEVRVMNIAGIVLGKIPRPRSRVSWSALDGAGRNGINSPFGDGSRSRRWSKAPRIPRNRFS